MRWRGRQVSGNVSDRRGMGGKLAVGGGLGGIVILVLTLLLGGNPLETINVGSQGNYTPSAEEDELAQFVGVVLNDTEDVWNNIFAEEFNADYREPTLVLFSQSDQSGCVSPLQRRGPSTARPITRFTSISVSRNNWRSALVLRVTLPWHM